MHYIVENNGVYGLTKGQFSATCGQKRAPLEVRGYADQEHWPLASTLLSLALVVTAFTFVARSFSGDKDTAGLADQAAFWSIKAACGVPRLISPVHRLQ